MHKKLSFKIYSSSILLVSTLLTLSVFINVKLLQKPQKIEIGKGVGNMTGNWTQIGLGGGGTFQSIGFSPSLNSSGSYTVYIGGDTLGLFKSADNGLNWVPSATGLYDQEVSKIIVNPLNSNTVYLTTNGGFYKSTDSGTTWRAKNFGRTYTATGNRNNMLASMAIDPKNPNTIFIGTGYLRNNGLPPDNATQIYKSSDGGESWGNSPVFSSSGLIVYGLAVNPNNSSSVYAALGYHSQGKLLHSSDGGSTWRTVDSNSSNVYYNLVFDNNNNLYASGWDGSIAPTGQCGPGSVANSSAMRIVRLDDTTGQVTDITPNRTATNHLNSTCKMDISQNGELYVGDNASRSYTVWKCSSATTCQTASWQPLPAIGRKGWLNPSVMNHPVWALAVSPDSTPWVGTSMMLLKLNANNAWDEVFSRTVNGGYLTRGNENTVITARDMVFLGRSEYYFGPADIYIEGTKDNGASFNQIRFPDPNSNMNDTRVLRSDSENPNIWYVSTCLQDQKTNHGKLLKKDSSGTWTTIFTSCSSGSCPFSSATVTNGGGILDVFAKGNLILVATYNDGVYRSTNGGSAWTKVPDLGVTDVNKFADTGNSASTFMAATTNGVWRSTDSGFTWTKLTGFPATTSYAVSWAGGNVWYVAGGSQIFKSEDNGITWNNVYNWQRKTDIYTSVMPYADDIAVGLIDKNNSSQNPVCASFNMIANYDHIATGGLACSIGGNSSTWQQPNMNGILGRGHGVEFNPFDPTELFYLTYGAGAFRTHINSANVSNTVTPTPSYMAGDINRDGIVDIIDFQLLSNSFSKSSGQSGYNPDADLNNDSVVDIIDFQILSNNFGK